MKQLTLEEKLELGIGQDFWRTKEIGGLSSLWLSDGPHGLRAQEAASDMIGINGSLPATCFPAAVSAGATWNRSLFYEEGKAIGQEAIKVGVDVVLGPGVNIKRNPLCGRNFEYLSDDPYFAGEMAASFIIGQQSNGVGSSLKHFAVNNQETKRFNSDSRVDERALREIYLPAFEKAVKKAKPATVMCSYNKINGVFASDNKWLLTDLLRKEWGFEGLVVTDWGAMHSRPLAYEAGCDLCMPGGSKYMEQATIAAIKQGKLDEAFVDKSVERLQNLIKQVKDAPKDLNCDYEAHHQLALKIAEQGAVLLKNEGVLPALKEDMVIIGTMAKDFRYQGAGSSHINPTRYVSLCDALSDVDYVPCGDQNGNVSAEELEVASKEAARHNCAVVVVGLPESYESEGFDREHMRLPQGYNDLVETVAQNNKRTVVVLLGGSAMELPWVNKVQAILYMGLAGQAGGQACANLLTGKVNPSGKLTETWPIVYEDVPSSKCYGEYDGEYLESIYVGYRYYDTAKKEVCFPFGHGLSYSTFEYHNLTVNDYVVSLDITNTSEVAGSEIVEVYVRAPRTSIHRPLQELKGFERVDLQAHETKHVSITLDDRAFALWHEGWKIIEGDYEIAVGSSSRDIRLKTTIQVAGVLIEDHSPAWYYNLEGKPKREDWEKLMGHPITPHKTPKKGEFTLDNSCYEMKQASLMMKIQYKVTENIVAKSFNGKKDYNDPSFKMMMICATDCPMHSVVINSNGAMSDNLAQGMLEMANGHVFKGLGWMLKK